MLAGVQLDKYAIGHQVSNQLNEKNNNLPQHKLDHVGNSGCYLKLGGLIALHCKISS